jgi:hypothetical protein
MRFAAGAGRKMIQLNKWTRPRLSRRLRGRGRAGERNESEAARFDSGLARFGVCALSTRYTAFSGFRWLGAGDLTSDLGLVLISKTRALSFGIPTLTHGARRLKCYQGRRPNTAGERGSEVADWSLSLLWSAGHLESPRLRTGLDGGRGGVTRSVTGVCANRG